MNECIKQPFCKFLLRLLKKKYFLFLYKKELRITIIVPLQQLVALAKNHKSKYVRAFGMILSLISALCPWQSPIDSNQTWRTSSIFIDPPRGHSIFCPIKSAVGHRHKETPSTTLLFWILHLITWSALSVVKLVECNLQKK